MHTLIVSNPGHFHAALALRNPHPLLRDDVYVYAEDGADLERFLGLVETFNSRAESPTHWRVHVYRGAGHLSRLIEERKGSFVLMAGKNHDKMSTIQRLQAAGFAVLCDKTWLIDGKDLPLVEKVVSTRPLALDIMTERHDVGHRILHSLCHDESVFGTFAIEADAPSITMLSVHHLFKRVNGRPLTRPAWYFDTAIQGEGIMDVTTHLTDLALWMTDNGKPCLAELDIALLRARQWATEVPLELFTLITQLPSFPPEIRKDVTGNRLSYRCNAHIDFRLRDVPVSIEEVWGLEEPAGGSDAFSTVLRGTRATLSLIHDASTGFASRLNVRPVGSPAALREDLERALDALATSLPGLDVHDEEDGFGVHVPAAVMTTHEQHFAKVLDMFLRQLDAGERPVTALSDLSAKYTLLAQAKSLSEFAAEGVW